MSTSAKIKETAQQEAQRVREIAEEGAKSGAYLYPLKVKACACECDEQEIDQHRASTTFATHKDLYKPLLSRLAPTLTLGAGITTFMFLYASQSWRPSMVHANVRSSFTYVPQLAVLFFTSGPLAAITTALLVLSESSTLTMVLSKALLIEDRSHRHFRRHAGRQRSDRLGGQGPPGQVRCSRRRYRQAWKAHDQAISEVCTYHFAPKVQMCTSGSVIDLRYRVDSDSYRPLLHVLAPELHPDRRHSGLRRPARQKVRSICSWSLLPSSRA